MTCVAVMLLFEGGDSRGQGRDQTGGIFNRAGYPQPEADLGASVSDRSSVPGFYRNVIIRAYVLSLASRGLSDPPCGSTV